MIAGFGRLYAMSLFTVPVMRLDEIQPHMNADKLELAVIGGYRAVVQKGLHQPGAIIVYIPEDSVFPAALADALEVRQYLVGKEKDRVKAIRLRGQLSQGMVMPLAKINEVAGLALTEADVGADLAEQLGIKKYEEPIPAHMSGVVRAWPTFLPHYDVENVKRPEFIAALVEGEQVFITEKLHGANLAVAWGPGLEDGESVFVCSRNQAIKQDPNNTYWRAVEKFGLIDRLLRLKAMVEVEFATTVENISIHGELLGVQNLKYGFSAGDPGFAAFDIRVNREFIHPPQFFDYATVLEIPHVPLVDKGPYSYAALDALAEADSSYGGVCEGVVVKPAVERRHDASGLGRVVLKYVSGRYLTMADRTDLR